MSTDFNLSCYVLGDALNSIFEVQIAPTKTVSDLKDAIKAETSKFKDVNAHALKLWSASIPIDTTFKEAIAKATFSDENPLSPADELSEIFLGPPNKHVHVVIKPPVDDQPPTKRPRLTTALDNMVDFHRKIWGKRGAHEDVFKLTAIVRGDPPSNVQTPDKCYVMTSPSYTSGSTGLNGILIRNEYIQAVEDIDAFYHGRDFAPNDDIEESDDMTDTTMQGDEAEMTMQSDVDTSTNNSVNVAESSADPFPTTISNPFLETVPPDKLSNRGVSIMGSPGIGKSLLLEFILHLRNLAGLPTLFVIDNEKADLFTETTVTEYSRLTAPTLSPHTWVLVDSNRNLTDVPEWVTRLNNFIVQAASPRVARIEWKKKTVNVSLYFLKPWSVEEILAARMLQSKPLSETALTKYCENYIPSARNAFTAESHESRETFLTIRSRISVQQVIKMLDNMSKLRVDDNSPHTIFVMRPGRTRNIPVVEFATEYLVRKVTEALKPKLIAEAQALFELYTLNSVTRGAVSDLLGPVVGGIFARVGWWKIYQMKKSKGKGKKFDHWKIQPSSPSGVKYLIVGLRDHSPLWISDTKPSQGAVYDETKVKLLPAENAVALTTAYYVPGSTTEATFDGFYYDAMLQQATVLQLTTSANQSMKVKGLERLKALGVKSVCYVAVTPLQSDFDLPVPIEYAKFLKETYHLRLENLN